MNSQVLPVHLTLFGGFDARTAAGEPLSLPTRKVQALLAYLALRPGHAHPRDKLAALLWGDLAEARARDSLRQALTGLRKALAATWPPALRTEGPTVALDPAGVEVDVVRFEEGAAQGTPEALERAVAPYQGELLEGLSVSEPPFEEWLMAERERLRELALEVLAKLLAHQATSGATEHAIQTAIRLLAIDPLEEAVHRALMRLYARQGRRAAALRQYQVCVGVLQRELGAEPETATKQLYRQLLRRREADGDEFEFGLLQRAAELTDREAADGVEELVRRRVLRGAREGFDFTHDRIREVAYSQLLPSRRKFLHGHVADALEDLYEGNLEPHFPALGHHCWEAEVWDKALTHLRRAGMQAAARSAHRQAAGYFERALRALEHLPDNRETLAQAVDVRFELRTSLVAVGEFDRVLRCLREAENLATRLEDQWRRG